MSSLAPFSPNMGDAAPLASPLAFFDSATGSQVNQPASSPTGAIPLSPFSAIPPLSPFDISGGGGRTPRAAGGNIDTFLLQSLFTDTPSTPYLNNTEVAPQVPSLTSLPNHETSISTSLPSAAVEHAPCNQRLSTFSTSSSSSSSTLSAPLMAEHFITKQQITPTESQSHIPQPFPTTTAMESPNKQSTRPSSSVDMGAQRVIDKAAERRRRNRESSSKCYYKRKRIVDELDSHITAEKRRLTALYDRALELRHENARLKRQVVTSGIPLPASRSFVYGVSHPDSAVQLRDYLSLIASNQSC